MSWYRLELRAGLDDVTDRAWREVWKVAYAGRPDDASNAIFRHAKRGAATLYFSPAAHELAKTFGAMPCKKPAGERVVLVAGADAACSLHFTSAQVSRPAPLAADEPPSAYTSTLLTSGFPTTLPTRPVVP